MMKQKIIEMQQIFIKHNNNIIKTTTTKFQGHTSAPEGQLLTDPNLNAAIEYYNDSLGTIVGVHVTS